MLGIGDKTSKLFRHRRKNQNSTLAKKMANPRLKRSRRTALMANGRSFSIQKDFTFVCPTEIVEFAKLNDEFADRDCIVLGGSSDNEFCKLAWRREHKDLNSLNQWSFFYDTNGSRSMVWAFAIKKTALLTARQVHRRSTQCDPASDCQQPERWP